MSVARVVDVSRAAQARRERVHARLLWAGGAGMLSLTLTVLPFAETGAWSQLALGQAIVAHGIPGAEPFSYLPAMSPWVAAGWLHDVLLAALVSAGGVTLASIALGLAASGGLVLAALSVRPSARVPAQWLAIGVLASALVARPFLLGGTPILLLGVGAVLYIVARAREGDSRLLWLLIPAFLLWANLDGSFVAGLLIVLVVWVTEPRRSAAFRRALLWAAVAGALAAVVNPAGVGLYQWLGATAGAQGTTQLTATFASPDFHDGWLRLFEAVAALLVISWVAGGGPARLDAVLALGAIALALWSQQFVPLFAVLAAPQLGVYGSRAWQRALAPRLPHLNAGAATRRLLSAPRVGALSTGGALVAVGLVTVAAIALQASPRAAAAAEASRDPRAAATRVAAAFPGQRLYTTVLWGDYLAYRFPSGRVVFMYGASGGFTDASAATYTAIHLLEPDWEAAVRAQGIRVAIVDDRSQEAGALHELGWAAACYDSAAHAVVMSAPAGGAPTTPSSTLTVPPTGVAAC